MLADVNTRSISVNVRAVICAVETQRETTRTASLRCNQVRIREFQRVRTWEPYDASTSDAGGIRRSTKTTR